MAWGEGIINQHSAGDVCLFDLWSLFHLFVLHIAAVECRYAHFAMHVQPTRATLGAPWCRSCCLDAQGLIC